MQRAIFACIFAFLLLTPFAAQRLHGGEDFRGVYAPVADDTYFYMARIQDVIDGHPTLSNAYLWEHKDGLPQQLFLAEFLLAQPLKLFGISVQTGMIVYTALFGWIVFFLVWTLFYLITKSKTSSTMFSLALLVGFFALKMLRPISPQFNVIFFLTLFIFLWKAYEEKIWKWFVFSGLNLGFLFYIYPYYWTFYLVLIVFLLILNRKFFLTLGMGGVLAVPYVILGMKTAQLPEYSETLTRLGMIHTRFPSGINVLLWTIPVLLLLVFMKRKNWFLIFGLIANIIVVNQHLITGKNFEFSSHYIMGAVIFAFAGIAYWLSFISPIRKFVIALVGIFFIARGTWGFFDRAVLAAPDPVFQERAEVIQKLKSLPKDSVVFADPDLSEFIPAYTHNNIFFSRNANLFFISDAEVLERFLIAHYHDTIDREFVIAHQRELFGVRYVDRYGHTVQSNKLRRLLGINPKPEIIIPEEVIENVLSASKEIHKRPFPELLKKYRVDYIL